MVRQSLAALYFERIAKSSNEIALQFKDGKLYHSWSWSELGSYVEELAYGLAYLGLEPKQCAAVMANTSHLWVAADLSILTNGAVSVPIYPTSSVSDVQHILNDSGAAILYVQNEKLLQNVMKVHGQVGHLRKVVLMTPPRKNRSIAEVAKDAGAPADLVIGMDELRTLGREYSKTQSGSDLLQKRVATVKPEDLATIIYTSGTTGTPKGVMLLNSTILSLIADLPDQLPITEKDTYLSFLPLSHVFERVCGEFYWLQNSCRYSFAEGLEHLPKNMQEVEPTVMLVVPRLLDKIHSKVMSGVDGASPRAQKLIRWALSVGRQVAILKGESKPIRVGLMAKHFVAEQLVFKKLRERIGSRLNLIVSGGAPATPDVIEFFNAIGLCVLEGYGLTETAAPTNVNRGRKNKIGTVGPALNCVQMRTAEDGEILFKGPSIFPGYFKNEELTKSAFTDGWFHSGDIGIIDADGYLKITDRKKDLIVNSSGKNIAPQKIEAVLRTVPFVSQAIVFGDKRKTLVAVLTLEEQAVMDFARDQGWTVTEYSELVKLPELKRHLQKQIDSRASHLADYERVRNFAILPQELSVESGELTATLKIKRNVIKQKYNELVEALYREEGVLVGSR
jgi:long-chain acyl-CoA synthetase